MTNAIFAGMCGVFALGVLVGMAFAVAMRWANGRASSTTRAGDGQA